MNLLKIAMGVLGVVRLRNKVKDRVQNLEVRAEILKLEWLLERRRWAKLVMWGVLAAVAVFITLLVLTLLVLACWWDSSDRVTVTACVAGFWVLVSAVALYVTVRTWHAGQQAFAVTRSELKSQWPKWLGSIGDQPPTSSN
jgi:uncharacterized membrane protein YqjE